MNVSLVTPKRIRKYTKINCNVCNKTLIIRNDYIKKHSGKCISCQHIGNKNALKHGDSKKRLYYIWTGMIQRNYRNYNPIRCEEWKQYLNFKKWALENGYKENLTIDRINNKGDYKPTNCQWITNAENAGKDKKLYTLGEEIDITIERLKLGITQRGMAKELRVSKNTIQRAEKNAKVVF